MDGVATEVSSEGKLLAEKWAHQRLDGRWLPQCSPMHDKGFVSADNALRHMREYCTTGWKMLKEAGDLPPSKRKTNEKFHQRKKPNVSSNEGIITISDDEAMEGTAVKPTEGTTAKPMVESAESSGNSSRASGAFIVAEGRFSADTQGKPLREEPRGSKLQVGPLAVAAGLVAKAALGDIAPSEAASVGHGGVKDVKTVETEARSSASGHKKHQNGSASAMASASMPGTYTTDSLVGVREEDEDTPRSRHRSESFEELAEAGVEVAHGACEMFQDVEALAHEAMANTDAHKAREALTKLLAVCQNAKHILDDFVSGTY